MNKKLLSLVIFQTSGRCKTEIRYLLSLFCCLTFFATHTLSAQDYCVPSAFSDGCATDNIDDFVILNSGINHLGSGCSMGSYGDFTGAINLQGTFQQGETYEFTVKCSSQWQQWTRIWIDFNGNGEFEDNESVFSSDSSSVVTTGTFIIPLTAPITSSTQLRVISRYDNLPPNACTPTDVVNENEGVYGETHDYTVEILPPPLCFYPSGLTAEILSLTSAELSWSSDGTLFDVEYGTQGFVLGSGDLVTGISDTFTTLSTLNANTNYEYYVRRDCGVDGYSIWAGPYVFYTNYCDATTQWPAGWTSISSFTTTSAIINISNNSGDNSYPNGYGDYAAMSVSHFETGEVSFTIDTNGWLGVNIWVDWNNNMVFEESEKVYTSGEYTDLGPFTGMFSVPVGQPIGNYRMRVRGSNDSGDPSPCGLINYGEIEDYTFTVIPTPTCMPPTQLGTNINSVTEAELYWTSEGSLFEIEYGIQGFTLGTATTITGITGNSTILSDLTENTYYQYFIRRDCSDGDLSPWTGPYTFYTNYCEAITQWAGDWESITSFTTIEGITNISNNTGGNSFPNGYGDYTAMSASHFEGGEVGFTITSDTWLGVNIWIDWNNDMVFEESEKVYTSGEFTEEDPFVGTFFVPVGQPVGDYRMRVRGSGDSGNPYPCGVIDSGETEDYTFIVIPTPSCIPPKQLGAIINTFTEAELVWTSEGTLFEVEYGLQGFALGTGTTITNITDTNTILSNLTENTHYQYYVRRDCVSDDFSPWMGPYVFYTNYCEAFTEWVGDNITSFVTTGGIGANISNFTGESPNGYGDYTNISVSHFETGSVDFTITTNYSLNLNMWIDWNNNMLFDEDELITTFNPIGFGVQTYTGDFTVPEGTPVGNYRIRLRAQYGNPPACGVISDGETEDYTLTVIVPPTCMPPTQLSANIMNLTSAEIFWTSEGDLFEVQYGLEGFALGTGTFLTEITTNSISLSGLAENTYHHFYVRRDCGDGDFSPWSGPYKFYTNYCEAFSLYSGENISSFVTTGGIPFDISNMESGDSPNGYGNFTAMSVHHFETGTVNFTITTNYALIVNMWIDWNNNMQFESSELITSFNPTGWDAQTYTGSFSIPIGTPIGNYRIRLRAQYEDPAPCGVISYGETEDYTLTVITPPSCLPPFAPTSINNSATSVSLSWQANGDLFDIEYGPVGFTPGTGTTISGVGNPYVLSGLESGVEYAYYVRQDCGEEDGSSTWNGPVAFTPGIYQGNIPTLLNSNPQVEDDACATSFSIEVPSGQYLSSLNVKYSMLSTSSAWTSQQRSVLYSPSLGLGEDVVVAGEIDFPGIQSYDRNVTFANGSTGTIEFQLKAWRTTGGTGCGTDRIYVIDESWILTPEFEDIPTCPDPATDLGYSNITEDSVDLIWEAESGSFQIIWDNAEFDPETEGTLVSGITTNSYTLSGLDSSVLYEFYVRRDCSSEEGEDFGEWVGPVQFNPGYCLPSVDIVHYFTQFYTTNAIDNIIITPTPGVGYVNSTSMVIGTEAGGSFNFTSNYIGGASGLRIWIDWNNDFIFEDSEEVFYQGSANGNKSGIITIPSDALSGDYRIRVRGQASADSVPSSCGQSEYGQTIDFTLSIPCGEVSSPVGSATQTFTSGSTLSDLSVDGSNLVWYSDSALTDVLDDTTLLVDGTTYYVVNLEGNCSSSSISVTVSEVLSSSDFTHFGFGYHPNPVSEVLYLRANTDIKSVVVFNILGQELSLPIHSNNTQIDMTGLPSGNYVMSVTIEGVNKTFKIVKK